MCRDDNYMGSWRNPETGEVVSIIRDEFPANPRDENYQTPMWHFVTVPQRDTCGIDEENSDEGVYEEAASVIRQRGLVVPVSITGYYETKVKAGKPITRIKDLPLPDDIGRGEGFAFLSRKQLHDEYGKGQGNVTKALKYLAGEIEEYECWANGNVWGFIRYDEKGREQDSIWGFYAEDYEELLKGCFNGYFKGDFTEEVERIEECKYKFASKNVA